MQDHIERISKQYNIGKDAVRWYIKNHPYSTIEEVEQHYIEREKHEQFKQECLRKGINYGQALAYRRKHPEKTDEEIVALYSNDERTVKMFCEKRGLSYIPFVNYKRKHPELSMEQLVDYYTNGKKDKNLKSLCRQYNVNYGSACTYKHQHKGISDMDIINHYVNAREKKSFRQKCLEAGINYGSAKGYRRSNPDLSDDEIIEKLKSPKVNIIKDLCDKYEVDYKKYIKYRNKYKALSEENRIQKYIEFMHNIPFKRLCEQYNVSYEAAIRYRRNHKELTDNQIIVRYRPDLRLNIFGGIIDE